MMEHNDVAVWIDLVKVPVKGRSTPLMQQTNQNGSSMHNLDPYPQPNNSLLARSSTPDREAVEEIQRLEKEANQ